MTASPSHPKHHVASSFLAQYWALRPKISTNVSNPLCKVDAKEGREVVQVHTRFGERKLVEMGESIVIVDGSLLSPFNVRGRWNEKFCNKCFVFQKVSRILAERRARPRKRNNE